MNLRALAVSTALAASLILFTGCLGSAPEPTPTPTAAFASEAEAFAAAEETYRAYIDAENARWADPHSDPDPQSFLVADALARDIASRQEMDQLGIRIVGESTIRSVTPVSAHVEEGDVVIRACVDSTNARVINEAGDDVTLADRDATVLSEVRFTTVGTTLAIEELLGVVSDEC